MSNRQATANVATKGRAPNRAQRRRGQPRRSWWRHPATIGAAILAVAVVGVLIQSQRASTPTDSVVRPAHVAGPGGSEVLGPADAPVLVEEYGDYQCPACGRFDRTVAPRIRELAAEGRIRFAYHPLAFLGPESVAAANAAVCAADQGRFWEFHEYAFGRQFPENSGALTSEQLVAFGSAAGTTGSAFEACVRDVTYEGWVGRLTDRAFESGVHSTPTVLVDGQRLEDPFRAVSAIEAALADR
jgi:protein-disulfide isomerase